MIFTVHFTSIQILLDMAAEKIIKDLEVRSGRSLKCLIKDRRDADGQSGYQIIFLSRSESKLCILMTNTDVQKFGMDIGKTFLIRNLDYMKNFEDIPMFKVHQSSSFRPSAISLEDTRDFTPDEINGLKSIDLSDIKLETISTNCGELVHKRLDSSSGSSSGTRKKLLLSLNEFLEMKPQDIGKDQYVEVF